MEERRNIYREPVRGQRERAMARTKRRRKRTGLCHIFLALLLAIGVFMACQVIMNFTRMSQLSNEIDQIEGQIAIKESERDDLEAKLEPYKRTSRIEEIAKLKLGLDYPKSSQIVRLDMDKETLAKDIAPKDEGILDTIISALRKDK